MACEGNAKASVRRRFSVAPGSVFDAWLDPGAIGRWMFGPALRDEEILHIRVDPRVGGKFSILVRRQGEEIDHVGTYVEIVWPSRLAFTWGVGEEAGDSSRVFIDIAPVDDGCELSLVHELHPDWAEYRERGDAGWTKMIGALASLVE